MVTIYLCSLYYYVSFNYRYYNIDKSQIIVYLGDFVLGTWYWGLGTGDLVLGIGDLGAASLKPVKSSIQRSLDRYMEVIND